MANSVGPHGYGKRPYGLNGNNRIDPKRIKTTIDASSIHFEKPNMMMKKDARLSTSHVTLWAAGLPTTYRNYHEYEDGALAFSTDYGDFFMLCDGVSGSKSIYTPQFVNALLRQLQKEIQEYLGDKFGDDNTSFKEPEDFYKAVLNILEYSLNSESVQSIKRCIDDQNQNIHDKMQLNYPATTLSILFLDHSNQLFYFICGDSGFQVKNLNGEIIHDLSGGTATPLFDINQFLDHPGPFHIMDYCPCPGQLIPTNTIADAPCMNGCIQLHVGARIDLASDGVWDNFKVVPEGDLFSARREYDMEGDLLNSGKINC